MEGRLTRANAIIVSDSTDPKQSAEFYKTIESMRITFFASCWHINDIESAGMWQAYTGMDKGIAIVSSVERLTTSISNDPLSIRISKLKYIDRRSEAVEDGNLFNPALSKGSYYSYENELRAFHWFSENKNVSPSQLDIPEFGINVKTELDMLIEKIVISPLAPQWFFDNVKSLCHAYNFETLVGKLHYSEMKEEAFI